MLKRATALLVTLFALLAASIAVASPAAANGNLYCERNQCWIVLSSPPRDPAPNPDANGWTRGAPTCYRLTSERHPETNERLYDTISCGNGNRYWSNARQCYVSLSGNQFGLTEHWEYMHGELPDRDHGAWYACESYSGGAPTTWFYSATVPPGLTVWPPGRAARELISTFALRGVDIGMAPQVNPEWGYRRSYVGIPVWLWVDTPQPLTWGPYTQTATLGGQTITATARVTSVRWDMGDGTVKTCGTAGTAYTEGYGLSDSPTCGHRYARTSTSQPGDRYRITPTSQWVVTWSSLSGASGNVNITTTGTPIELDVNELQAVNVGPNG